MNRISGSARIVGIVIVLVLLVVAGVLVWRCRCRPPAIAVAQPECPDHDVAIRDPENRAVDSIVPVAGAITPIAEFHDCQRMISPANGSKYGPLIGIWASDILDTLPVLLAEKNAQANGPGIGLAFAEIYAWDGSYDPLGIARGWNCLYLFPDDGPSGYKAFMVPVKTKEACLEDARADTLTGPPVKPLNVVAQTFRNARPGDVPMVARWDWDSVNRVQYIGIGCGNGWCEVTGQAAPQSSPSWDTGDQDRWSWRVKGWFDRQLLAEGAGLGIHPSPVWGTVVPDADLAGKTRISSGVLPSSGTDPWVHVGRASMSMGPTSNATALKYSQKFNLVNAVFPHGAPPQGWADIYLCAGGESQCFPAASASIALSIPSCATSKSGIIWYAMIRSPNMPPKYTCVTQVRHSGLKDRLGRPITIPGTARWRWVNDDEKLWVACDNGCCQVQ